MTRWPDGGATGLEPRYANYTVNSLNQYTQRTVPGYTAVMGIAIATNAVTVNGQAAYRKGEYFRKEVPVDNSAGPVWTNISVVGGQASVSGHTLVAPDTESFTYDQDGNLTGDGLWSYGWDGENRLSSMESVWNLPDEAKKRLEFTCDWQGRRIEKVVYAWDPDWYWYMPQYTNRFVYDGWNLVAILDGDNTPLLSFTWATDLSGTMQGAGGVGGLLAVTVHSGPNTGTYFYCYDGNGNVVALVSAVDGTVAARYEYGPFGELLRATGPMAKANPLRFSTKCQDDETDLIYYGYRYYNASTGRWLSRDPIGEIGFTLITDSKHARKNKPGERKSSRQSNELVKAGGPNLYCFVNNNPIENSDYLGLIKVCIRPLQMCPFTTIIVHCFLDMEDGTTYAYDPKGIHADPNPNSSKKTCVDISPSSITAEEIKKKVEADKTSGKWDGGDDYGFVGQNCCHWVDQVLTSLGSSGVASYFPGYKLPPCRK